MKTPPPEVKSKKVKEGSKPPIMGKKLGEFPPKGLPPNMEEPFPQKKGPNNKLRPHGEKIGTFLTQE